LTPGLLAKEFRSGVIFDGFSAAFLLVDMLDHRAGQVIGHNGASRRIWQPPNDRPATSFGNAIQQNIALAQPGTGQVALHHRQHLTGESWPVPDL